MNVYQSIAAVAKQLAHSGIAKTRSNTEQKYKFRGIDDVYNALAPILADSGLVIIPRMMAREQTERVTRSGGALFSVVVEAEFDFISAEDGSKHTARTFGEAMDTADKATNKAMSAAYKYAAFQTFCIPTDGDNDADATTPEVASLTETPEYKAWLAALTAEADKGLPALTAFWQKSSPEPYRALLPAATRAALRQKAESVQVPS